MACGVIVACVGDSWCWDGGVLRVQGRLEGRLGDGGCKESDEGGRLLCRGWWWFL